MRWLFFFALSLSTVFASVVPASAVLEERDLLVAGDGLITFDTDTGLEWLDLEATDGETVSDAIAAWQGLGFAIADTDQTSQLFLNAGFSAIDGTFSVADFVPAQAMLGLTGCTHQCGTDFASGRGWAKPGTNAPPIPGAEFFSPLYRIDLFFLNPPGIFLGIGLANSPDGFSLVPDPQSVAIGTFLVRPGNEAPDCTEAQADPDFLWAPDHELETISIVGITDPDGDPVTVSVTAISQDEPLDGLGDGDTSPDGEGIGTDTPRVRAERAGPGDGRVYHIGFSAEDDQGGECSGIVTVCVPHDQMPGSDCVDQGPLFDSTGENQMRNAIAPMILNGECGLGSELALLLPPLLWLRGRRRRTGSIRSGGSGNR